MTTQKRRNVKDTQSGSDSIDLGVIELNAIQPGAPEQFLATGSDLAVAGASEVMMSETSLSPAVSVGVYKLSDTAQTPRYATSGCACFDLNADFSGVKTVKVYTAFNIETERPVQRFREYDDSQGVVIDSGERALIPTNLIFDIPENWKMLIYPRSGTALKQAMTLANSVGVVDSDYVDPSFVIIFNQSKVRLIIKQGDRIAQAELVPVFKASFNSLTEAPKQKTARVGGFGSTGK